jgi:iron complex outermembrane receptor protein
MKRIILRFMACGYLVAAVTVATAQQNAEPVSLNISAQPLAQALTQLAVQADLKLVYYSDIEETLSAPAVVGRYTPEAALRLLLQHTALHADFADAHTVLIRSDGAEPHAGTQTGSRRDDRTGVLTSEASATRLATLSDGADVGPSNSESGSSSSDSPAESPTNDLEEIVITGTNIRGIKDSPSPVRTISRAEIDATGVATSEDLMALMPENVGGVGVETSLAGIPAQNGTNNSALASGINLRGLGSDSTLVLLNGHRLPLASDGFSVDISTIPLAVVDHVDILKDGASSIYGSDAVAGVVNFVTIHKFNGAETSVTGGGVTQGGKRDLNLNQLLGTSWDTGSVFGSYTYNSQGALSAGDRVETAGSFLPSDVLPTITTQALYFAADQQISSGVTGQIDVLGSDRKLTDIAAEQRKDPTTKALGVDGVDDRRHNTSLVVNGSVDWAISSSWRISGAGQYAASHTRATDNDAFNLFPSFTTLQGGQYGLDLTADGGLVELPGGTAKLAVGGSYRRERYKDIADYTVNYNLARKIDAGFGELFVPLIGSANALTFVQRLELTASDRYDHYSDFGGTNNPKVGLVFAPSSSVSLKGTYSTAFRAPLLSELAVDPSSSVDLLGEFPDPQSAGGQSIQILRLGGNPELKPETSRSFTGGLELHPETIRNLLLSGDYFSIDFKNRITTPGGGTNFISEQPNLFGPFLTRDPSAALVNSVASGPLFESLIPGWTPADVVQIADQREQNLSSVKVSGLDLDGAYSQAAPVGKITYRLDASYILKYEETVVPGMAPIVLVNTPYYPANLKFRTSLGWAASYWSSTVAANYVNSYSDNRDPTAVVHVGSWTTVDWQVGFALRALTKDLTSARITLSVQNLLARRAPFVLSQSGESVLSVDRNYDPVNASALGRYLSLRFDVRL